MMMMGIGMPISQASAPFMAGLLWLLAGTTPALQDGSRLRPVDMDGPAPRGRAYRGVA